MYPRNYPSVRPLPGTETNVKDYAAVAMSALRRLPPYFREHLRKSGQWDDIVAWAGVAAVEGRNNRWDQRDTYNAAQRYIYHALKAAGYVRPWKSDGYKTFEYTFDPVPDDPDEPCEPL